MLSGWGKDEDDSLFLEFKDFSIAEERPQNVEKWISNESFKINRFEDVSKQKPSQHRDKSKEFFLSKKRLWGDAVLTAQYEHIQT